MESHKSKRSWHSRRLVSMKKIQLRRNILFSCFWSRAVIFVTRGNNISSRNSSHVLLVMLFRRFKQNKLLTLLVLNKREDLTIYDNHRSEHTPATVRSRSLAWRTADRPKRVFVLRPIGKWKETENLWKMCVEIAKKFSSSTTQYHWLNIHADFPMRYSKAERKLLVSVFFIIDSILFIVLKLLCLIEFS